MHSLVRAEFTKMRKNRIYILCLLITLAAAAFLVVKDFFLAQPPEDHLTWFYSAYTVNLIFLPLMSSFVITFLIQREYQEQTLINLLTAPVSRLTFILAKLLVWFVWYVVAALLSLGIYILGYYLIYPDAFSAAGVGTLAFTMMKLSLLGFASFTPLLWVSIRQKKTFFPSVLTGLAFTGIGLAATSVSEEMMRVAMIIPWTASPIISIFDLPNQYSITGLCSVIVVGILGVIGAYIAFRRQDQ